jgi:uncharacterized membrane protein
VSYIVVKTFENESDAASAHKFLVNSNLIDLNDVAIVERNLEGKVQIKNETYRGEEVGVVGGGLLGALIGGIIFPVGGIVIGSIAGGLISRFVSHPIDKDFIKDVAEHLKPGSSALFVIVRGDTPDSTLDAMKTYQGKVHYTSMPEESEAALRSAMSSLGNPLEE